MTEIEKQYRELHDLHPTKMYDKYVYIILNNAEHDRHHPMFSLPKLKIFIECVTEASKLGRIKDNINAILIPALRNYYIDNL